MCVYRNLLHSVPFLISLKCKNWFFNNQSPPSTPEPGGRDGSQHTTPPRKKEKKRQQFRKADKTTLFEMRFEVIYGNSASAIFLDVEELFVASKDPIRSLVWWLKSLFDLAPKPDEFTSLQFGRDVV